MASVSNFCTDCLAPIDENNVKMCCRLNYFNTKNNLIIYNGENQKYNKEHLNIQKYEDNVYAAIKGEDYPSSPIYNPTTPFGSPYYNPSSPNYNPSSPIF